MGAADDRHADLESFDELWDYDAPAETEKEFRRLLVGAGRRGHRDLRVQLLTQIARTQGLQRRFDEAHATLDDAAALLGEDTPIARVRVLLERGRVYNSSKQPERARSCFLEAWETGRAIGAEYHAVDAAHMMAIVDSPVESLRWNERALAYAEASPDQRTRHWIGSVSNNIGWSHHAAGDFVKALSQFERAYDARVEEGVEKDVRTARWCIARCLRSLGRLDEALAIQLDLHREHEKAGSGDGYVDEELGECLHALGREADACPHFARAYERLGQDPWLAENEATRLERLRVLGNSPTGGERA